MPQQPCNMGRFSFAIGNGNIRTEWHHFVHTHVSVCVCGKINWKI